MGNRQKLKPHERKSLIAGQSKRSVKELESTPSLLFSFKHLDETQGQTLAEWAAADLMPKTIERFRDHCKTSKHTECFCETFKTYGTIPAHSEFKHPAHVPEDADWASMHIQGKPCIIGHMVKNVFYMVFLDAEHKFYPTEKKNT